MGNLPTTKNKSSNGNTLRNSSSIQRGNFLSSSRSQKLKVVKNSTIPRVSSFGNNILSSNLNGNNSNSMRNSAKLTIKAKDISIEKSSLFKPVSKVTDKTEINYIISTLSKHPLFSSLETDYLKTMLAKQMNRMQIKNNTLIYGKQNEPDFCYLLYKGTILIKDDDDVVQKEVKESELFGEEEIINNTMREYNAVCGSNSESIIFSLSKDNLLDAIKFIRKKNKENIDSFFNSYFPVMNMYDTIKKNLINDCVILYSFNEGVPINYQNNIYIIYSGEVNTIFDKEIAKVLRKGDIIGHRELIVPNAKPNISLMTKIQSEVIAIPYNVLKKVFPNNSYIYCVTFFMFYLCFQRSEILKNIDIGVLFKIYPLFSLQSILPNEVIYPKGDCLNEEVIVVLEGNIFKEQAMHYEAIRNTILYEKELIYNSHSVLVIEDLIAFPECVILRANNDKIKSVLNGMTLRDILNSTTKKKALQNMTVDLLKHCNCYNLSKIKLSELEKHISIEKYDHNVTIIKQGSKDLSKFYIIKSGYVSFYINNKFTRTLATNSPFGFKAYISNSPTRTATAIANGTCEVFAVSVKAFMNLVVNDNPQIMTYFKNKICLEDDTLTLPDFDNIRLLGKGSFGYVNLVKSKKNKYLYAIKAIPLMKIIQSDMYELIQNEKNILKMLDHNFLMKNVISLKNNDFVFIINEYIKGKTLSKIIKEASYFNKTQTQFYIGSLLVVIEYLHSNNFIHRDIKPDNIMINSNGYIKLIDFGTVKETSSRNGTTHTIIGTPHYMAPEVIMGQSYSSSVDFWSIGICLYEFYIGKVPFGSDLKDPNDIYKAVLNTESVPYPNSMHDREAMSLINGMLAKDINKRLVGPEIKKHPWFEGFNWKGLDDMSLAAPIRPSGNDYDDNNSKTSNYLNMLKVLASSNENRNSNKKEITPLDIEKGEKWLKDF